MMVDGQYVVWVRLHVDLDVCLLIGQDALERGIPFGKFLCAGGGSGIRSDWFLRSTMTRSDALLRPWPRP